MELTLRRNDLLKDRQDMACSRTSFEDFQPKVQEAIRLVGRAVIRDFSSGYENYNAIHPPKEE